MIIVLSITASMILTGVELVRMKEHGTLERVFTSAVTPLEQVASLQLAVAPVCALQAALTMITAFWWFAEDNVLLGSPVLMWLLVLLAELSSLPLGISIGGLVKTQLQAQQLSFGIVFLLMQCCGIIWPLRGAPEIMQTLALALPVTWLATAGRDVANRGWGVEAVSIRVALGLSIFYIILFSASALIGVRPSTTQLGQIILRWRARRSRQQPLFLTKSLSDDGDELGGGAGAAVKSSTAGGGNRTVQSSV